MDTQGVRIDERRPRVGYVGLGDQGSRIVLRLLDKRFPVVLWARRAVTLERFTDTEAGTAISLRSLGEASDIVGVCVTGDGDVREVVDEDLLQGLGPGGIVLIQSTVLPSTCQELAARAREHGVGVVDAPVSSGYESGPGDHVTMVGGEPEAVSSCRPVLDALGRSVHLGDVGSGQRAKICNNVLFAANVATALEAFSAGRRFGLENQDLLGVLRYTSGGSFALTCLPMLTDPSFVDHAVATLEKDLGLFEALSQSTDGGSELLTVAQRSLRHLQECAAAGWLR